MTSQWLYRIDIECITVQAFVQTENALIQMVRLYIKEIIMRRVPQGSPDHLVLSNALMRLDEAETYEDVANAIDGIAITITKMCGDEEAENGG